MQIWNVHFTLRIPNKLVSRSLLLSTHQSVFFFASEEEENKNQDQSKGV